jgi:hypothetical protein
VRSAARESETDCGDKLELLWAALVCFKYIRYMSLHKCNIYVCAYTCVLIYCLLDAYYTLSIIPNATCRPVEKSYLIGFQDLFDALKDVLCPPKSDEDDPEENQQLPGGAGGNGVESLQQLQWQQRISQLLLLYSQCLSSFVCCFSHSMKGERERESGELSLPVNTHILQILM